MADFTRRFYPKFRFFQHFHELSKGKILLYFGYFYFDFIVYDSSVDKYWKSVYFADSLPLMAYIYNGSLNYFAPRKKRYIYTFTISLIFCHLFLQISSIFRFCTFRYASIEFYLIINATCSVLNSTLHFR